MDEIDWGQLAYEARFVDNRYRIPWHELPEESKIVWRCVADTVIDTWEGLQ